MLPRSTPTKQQVLWPVKLLTEKRYRQQLDEKLEEEFHKDLQVMTNTADQGKTKRQELTKTLFYRVARWRNSGQKASSQLMLMIKQRLDQNLGGEN
jgi:hypothetical protein